MVYYSSNSSRKLPQIYYGQFNRQRLSDPTGARVLQYASSNLVLCLLRHYNLNNDRYIY